MTFLDFILLVGFLVFLVIYYYQYKFSYWKKLGVPYLEPKYPHGNVEDLGRKLCASEFYAQIYFELKRFGEKFCGIYNKTEPVAIITDLDFLKNVLIKDSDFFYGRGIYYNIRDDPLRGHLFNIEGDYWKKMRSRLTPSFTSGKLREMTPTIIGVTKFLDIAMMKTADANLDLDLYGMMCRFSIDVIGQCAFGIECNSLDNKNEKFVEMGMNTFHTRLSFYNKLKRQLAGTNHELGRKLRIKVTRPEDEKFYKNLVKDVIEYREKNKIHRPDFMEQLLKMENKGDFPEDRENGARPGKLSFGQIAAQSYIFFLAGFESSSSALTFCLHELSMNEEIQDKARQEIQDVLEKHNGQLSYEAVSEMHYLERCINESIRKYPNAPFLFRVVTKDYKVPQSKIVLKKGLTILIPVFGIHRDPEFYENPEEFNPDRFTIENIAKRHPMAFIPFGEGLRACPANRFSILEAKLGLATLLPKFKFFKTDRTKLPLEFSKTNICLGTSQPIYVKVEKIRILE